MAIPITVPRLGWNMEQGVFVGWLKADGAPVRTGESLFTIESEKATEDVECLDSGILHIPANAPRKGDVVAVGAVIAHLLQPGEPLPVATTSRRSSQPKAVTSGVAVSSQAPALSRRDQAASTPRARRRAADLGVDWTRATGTGRDGRIRERDVFALHTSIRTAPGSTRRVIAERMLASHRSTAPVTLTTTIDATALVQFREQRKACAKVDMIPSYLDLFVKVAAIALQKHPALNARWENDGIVTSERIHIGIAVDSEAGLVVPILRDVPRLSLPELSARTRDVIDRARLGKLSLSEMQGGTFTVTSLGGLGIDAFTPIINYPECAILGIGRIRRCPVVWQDQIVVRDQVTLSLTFDHRIVDGAPAARFLQTLTALVQRADALDAHQPLGGAS